MRPPSHSSQLFTVLSHAPLLPVPLPAHSSQLFTVLSDTQRRYLMAQRVVNPAMYAAMITTLLAVPANWLLIYRYVAAACILARGGGCLGASMRLAMGRWFEHFVQPVAGSAAQATSPRRLPAAATAPAIRLRAPSTYGVLTILSHPILSYPYPLPSHPIHPPHRLGLRTEGAALATLACQGAMALCLTGFRIVSARWR